MNESKHLIIDTQKVRRFAVDDAYSSKMLLDDAMVGRRTVQINQGLVAPGCSLDGAIHTKDEIYYILEGNGEIVLGDEVSEIRAGHLVFIPAGTFHALANKRSDRELVLLTLWREPGDNEVYEARIKQWGASFVMD